MQLVVTSSPPENWENFLENFDGNIYHSEAWAEISRKNHSVPLYFTAFDEQSNCIGIATGIKSWSKIPLIGRYSKRLDFESYPAVRENDPQVIRAFLNKLYDYSQQQGYNTLAVQSYMANVSLPNLDNLGFTINERWEFIVDLKLENETLWKQLSSHHRRKIRKAEKEDLVLEEAATLEALLKFRKLQIMSRDRRIERGENIGMLDDSYYEELGDSYFKNNLGRIFLLKNNEQAVSSAFVSIYAGKAFYVYGGSSDDGFRMNAPGLLFWKIFSRCKELGCSEFNLGGVPASASDSGSQSHGLYRFKAGFGGKQVKCYSGSVDILKPGLGSVVLLLKKILKIK